MIRRLIERVKLYRNPPKAGDVFWTDSFDFLAGRVLEHIFHGLRRYGGEPLYEPIHGEKTYRMEIISSSMPYYVIRCDVLAQHVNDKRKDWFRRSRDRRVPKDAFNQMVIDGSIAHEQSKL